MPTVVLGVTGCIGAYKACEVLRELQRRGVDVHVVMTRHATEFVTPMTFEALSRHPVFLDQFALGAEGDIRHISLADAAQVLLVAPATANILGKFARGIADDALTTLYLATKAQVVVAPAMNVNMFDHPAVRENLDILRARGARVVEPGSGYLACGWLGRGRLAEPEDIVAATMAVVGEIEGGAADVSTGADARADLAGETVLVTAGPTVEDLDPVRFLSNRSTGRMGFALAESARVASPSTRSRGPLRRAPRNDPARKKRTRCGPTTRPPTRRRSRDRAPQPAGTARPRRRAAGDPFRAG